MNLEIILGVMSGYGLGVLCVAGGVYQLYQVVVGLGEDLTLGRFRLLYPGKPSPTGKRVFWLFGGILLILSGVEMLGGFTFVLLN